MCSTQEWDEPGMLKCHKLDSQISPCIGCFLPCTFYPIGGKRCHLSAVKPLPRPSSDQTLHALPSFSIPSALCHGVVFLRAGYSLGVLSPPLLPLPTHCLGIWGRPPGSIACSSRYLGLAALHPRVTSPRRDRLRG